MKVIRDSGVLLSQRLGQRLRQRLERSAFLDRSDWVAQVFYLFLATDISFIALHLIYLHTHLITNEAFSLETDRGYSEIFQYIKEYWAALVLAALAWRKQSSLYLIWSLLFAYLLLDDALQIHETVGGILNTKFAFPALFDLRPKDFGELAVSGAASAFFVTGIALAYRSADRPSRRVATYLSLLLVVLGFFGVAVDMLHIAMDTPPIRKFLAVVEDGGELVTMSVMSCYVLSLLKRLS